LQGRYEVIRCSVSSVVTDPPYGLSKEPNIVEMLNHWLINEEYIHNSKGFMGKDWDSFVPNPSIWKEAYRVLKPGGYLLCFAGTRTYDLMCISLRLAGFEIRDQIDWIFGSGFPKSQDISKMIDKLNSKTSEDIKILKDELKKVFDKSGLTLKKLNQKCGFEASGYLRKSSTWETILPTVEKWNIMRTVIGCDDDFTDKFKEAERKIIGKMPWNNSRNHFTPGEDHKDRIHLDITEPSTDKAKEWSGYGTSLKPAHEPIIVARKPLSEKTIVNNVLKWNTGGINIDDCRIEYVENDDPRIGKNYQHNAKAGLENGSKKDNSSGEKQQLHNNQGRFPANIILDEEAGKLLDLQSGIKQTTRHMSYKRNGGEFINGIPSQEEKRWFVSENGGASRFFYCAKSSKKEKGKFNNHPTVKPLSLIKYLVTLVTPPKGICLDPFEGSGTTFIACQELGFNHIGFELSKEYCEITEKRIKMLK